MPIYVLLQCASSLDKMVCFISIMEVKGGSSKKQLLPIPNPLLMVGLDE